MFSVSVTNFDAFRRYRDREEMTLAELMKQLRREAPQTEKMLAGVAFHRLLEMTLTDCEAEEMHVAAMDGHQFVFTLNDALDLPAIREMRGTKTYTAGGVPITLRGRVDAIHGTEIVDHKLSSQFDVERYHDSYQWRAYLSMFGGNKFTYNVFIGEPTGEVDGLKEWEVSDFHRLVFYRYPEMENDLLRELGLFVEFAKVHLQEAA